ncbi:MAG: hypothetical protein DI617_09230, partial [Streptococcus pyogenes]
VCLFNYILPYLTFQDVTQTLHNLYKSRWSKTRADLWIEAIQGNLSKIRTVLQFTRILLSQLV